jgi:hypothetical protein
VCVCKDAENPDCVQGANDRVTFVKDGKTYTKSVIKFIGKNMKVRKIKEEDEPYFELNCPEGWAPRDTKSKALGTDHGWPEAKAANHPSLTCYLPCPANYQAAGVTLEPANPQCDCEVTLNYEDTACDPANSKEELLTKKGCKWSGRITNIEGRGWRIHYLPGEYQPETKEPECRTGWEKQPMEVTGGHIVCVKKGTCKEIYPEIPCGSKDQELVQAQHAVLVASMPLALKAYEGLAEGFTPCKAQALKSMPSDDGSAASVFLSESEKSSLTQPKQARGKLIELAALAQRGGTHKYGPTEMILMCIGVASKASEVFIQQKPGGCEDNGVHEQLCFDPDYYCMTNFPKDFKAYSNSEMNTGGMYLSSAMTTALFPPRLKRQHFKTLSTQLINTCKAADAKLPGRPQLSCQAIAKSVFDHLKTVPENKRNLKGCIEAAFKAHDVTFPKNWFNSAVEYIKKQRAAFNGYHSRGLSDLRVKSRKKCQAASKQEAKTEGIENRKLDEKREAETEMAKQQDELDKNCIFHNELWLDQEKQYTDKTGSKKKFKMVWVIKENHPRKSKYRDRDTCTKGPRNGLCTWNGGGGYCGCKQGGCETEAEKEKAKTANQGF